MSLKYKGSQASFLRAFFFQVNVQFLSVPFLVHTPLMTLYSAHNNLPVLTICGQLSDRIRRQGRSLSLYFQRFARAVRLWALNMLWNK